MERCILIWVWPNFEFEVVLTIAPDCCKHSVYSHETEELISEERRFSVLLPLHPWDKRDKVWSLNSRKYIFLNYPLPIRRCFTVISVNLKWWPWVIHHIILLTSSSQVVRSAYHTSLCYCKIVGHIVNWSHKIHLISCSLI